MSQHSISDDMSGLSDDFTATGSHSIRPTARGGRSQRFTPNKKKEYWETRLRKGQVPSV